MKKRHIKWTSLLAGALLLAMLGAMSTGGAGVRSTSEVSSETVAHGGSAEEGAQDASAADEEAGATSADDVGEAAAEDSGTASGDAAASGTEEGAASGEAAAGSAEAISGDAAASTTDGNAAAGGEAAGDGTMTSQVDGDFLSVMIDTKHLREPNIDPATGYYIITGYSSITAQDLANYYRKNATYPAFYANSDAPTLEDFCQMYVDECAMEGICVEVAFCQAMLETGYLTYGGDVDISQYNFAGVGATGGGVAGVAFPDVRTGIRVHVQHLKAYANTEPLLNPCIDPRFDMVVRGEAPVVELLGIQENPNHRGWAASAGYGKTLHEAFINQLFL